MSQARLTEAADGSTSSSHATIACPTDLCIHPPTISDNGTVKITIPFLHDAPSYLARQVQGWRNLDREAFRSALLDVPAIVDRPFWMTFRLPTSSPSMKQPWLASSTGFFLRIRPRFVDAPSPCGSTPSVARSCAGLADMRGNIDALSWQPIARPGCTLSETCTEVTVKGSGHTGKPRSSPMPKILRGCGPPLTLYLAGVGPTASQTSLSSRPKTSCPRSMTRSMTFI